VSSFDIGQLRRQLLPANANLTGTDSRLPGAAVAVIIDLKKRGGAILLIRRTEREDDRWSGQIAFPGGHIIPTDENLLETAIRETEEEVGIPLREHELIGALPLVYARSRTVRVAPFVFQLKRTVEIQHNVEVADAFWMDLAEIANSVIKNVEVNVADGKRRTDSYVYRGNVIWGLTFRIINLLLGRNIDVQQT